MPMAVAFRSRLIAREALYGAWSVIPSPLSVRLLAAAGLDYVVIDLRRVWAACAAAGKPVGVHATDGAIARRYREAGACTLITTADDAALITRNTAAQPWSRPGLRVGQTRAEMDFDGASRCCGAGRRRSRLLGRVSRSWRRCG